MFERVDRNLVPQVVQKRVVNNHVFCEIAILDFVEVAVVHSFFTAHLSVINSDFLKLIFG